MSVGSAVRVNGKAAPGACLPAHLPACLPTLLPPPATAPACWLATETSAQPTSTPRAQATSTSQACLARCIFRTSSFLYLHAAECCTFFAAAHCCSCSAASRRLHVQPLIDCICCRGRCPRCRWCAGVKGGVEVRGAGTGDVGIAAASGAAGKVTVTGSMAGTGKLLHTAGVECDIQVGRWMGLAFSIAS